MSFSFYELAPVRSSYCVVMKRDDRCQWKMKISSFHASYVSVFRIFTPLISPFSAFLVISAHLCSRIEICLG